MAKCNPAGCENTEPIALHGSQRKFGNTTVGTDHRLSAPRGKTRLGQLLPHPPAPQHCCPILTLCLAAQASLK